jgi:hypothetical protein
MLSILQTCKLDSSQEMAEQDQHKFQNIDEFDAIFETVLGVAGLENFL